MPSVIRNDSAKSVLATGLGSAHRIIAKAMEQEFVEQGIIKQPLQFRKLKKNYALCFFSSSLCFSYDRYGLFPAPDPAVVLWAPAAIPREVWTKAVAQFQIGGTLEHSIEQFLLPYLAEPLACFSYERLLDTAEQLFLAEDIRCVPIRKIKDTVYYFDEAKIYRADQGSIFKDIKTMRRTSLWFSRMINMSIWYKASTRFQEGASLRQCIDLFFKTELTAIPKKESFLDRFITRIEPAIYEREPKNMNGKTFDRIHVFVNLSSTFHPTWAELRQAVKEHRAEIDRLVIEKVTNDRRFRKYGIPINSLKLTVMLLRRECCLEYIFELKDSVRDLSDPTS